MKYLKVRAGGVFGLGVLFLPFSLLAQANSGFTNGGGIPCIWRTLTGYPCPGCGLTRALGSISTLDFNSALHFNPIAFLIPGALLAAAVAPQLLSRANSLQKRLTSNYSDKQIVLFLLLFFAILWILNGIRVSTGFYPAP